MPKQKRKFSWIRFFLVCVLLGGLLGVLALVGIVHTEERLMAQPWPEEADAIVVLGASVWPDGPSPTLVNRVDQAYDLYEAGIADVIVVCGAQGEDEPMSEADCMRDMLVRYGVPYAHILLDDTSTDTWENLQNAKALLNEQNLEDCVIVTSDYHLQRSLFLASVHDLPAEGVGAITPWRAVHWKMRLREILAWGKVVLRLMHIL